MLRPRSLLIFVIALAAALPASAQDDAFSQLEALMDKAPSRHPSQPGAKVVGDWVAQRFNDAAEQQNDPAAYAAAKAALEKVHQANLKIFEAHRQIALPSDTDPTTLDADLQKAARAAYKADLEAARALDGLWHKGQIHFPAAVYHPGKAEISAGGNNARLYQVEPNLFDPGNLPEEGFAGDLVYVGHATPNELSGVNLEGRAVLVEFASANRWIDAIQLGARVVIVIEPENANFLEAQQKSTVSAIRVPRFYIKRDDLQSLYGSDWKNNLAATPAISIQQQPGVWKRQQATIDWLFIPGTAEPKPDELIHLDAARQVVHLQAYRDADSFVPELAPGATAASNLVLLMQVLDHYEKNPPLRPTLLSVVDMHCNALMGETEYASAVFSQPESYASELRKLYTDLGTGQFIAELYRQPITLDMVESFRGGTERVAGQTLKINKPILDELRTRSNELRMQREDAFVRRRTLEKTGKLTAEDEADFESQVEATDKVIAELEPFMRLFNRFGKSTKFEELTPEQVQWLQDVFAEIADKSAAASQALTDRRAAMYRNLDLRRRLLLLTDPKAADFDVESATANEIFLKRHPAVDANTLIALDLTFGTQKLGFFPIGEMTSDRALLDSPVQRASRFARHAIRVAEEMAAKRDQPHPVEHTIRTDIAWSSFLGGAFAMGSTPAHLHDRLGVTLTGVRDSRPYTFTPHDTIDRINRGNFDRLMAFSKDYILTLAGSEGLGGSRRSIGKPDPIIIEVDVRMQDQFSVTVPQTPTRGALVALEWDRRHNMRSQKRPGQVRGTPIWMTDARGTIVLRSGLYRSGSLIPVRYDADYRQLNAALDMGMEGRFSSAINEAKKADVFVDKLIVTFEATKIDLVGATEPVNLMPITTLQLLDAQQETTPQHYMTLGVPEKTSAKSMPNSLDGTASIMIEPDLLYKVIAGLSLVINATPEHQDGIGFTTDVKMLPDLVSLSAADTWELTDSRLDLLESKGVVNETARAFNTAAGEQVEKAAEARANARYDEALIHAEKARGLAYWAYVRATGTMNDLVKAAVIFLALVIPFCFFLMKLITPFTDVNRQLALFALVFVMMALLLWMVHPAFKVARTPSVVILAFVIMGLAMFVASVLISRFNSAMNQAIEQSQMSESVDAPQGRLAGVAFMVGVNNMKRRRIRTALTCATIVLVTFTMLSVISVGQDVEPARVRLAKPAPYNGFVFTRPGLGPMSATQVRRLRAHYKDKATVIARTWSYETGLFGEYLPYHIAAAGDAVEGEQAHLETKVLLGLEQAEDGFLGQLPLVGDSRWFSSNNADEMVLSVEAAALLGITPDNFKGKRLTVRGREVELIGLIDDEKLEGFEDLGEVPLLPLLQEASQSSAEASQQQNASQDAIIAETSGAADLEAGGDLLSQPGVQVARPIDVAFVPTGFAESLGKTSYHMLSMKYALADGERPADAAKRAWLDATELIRFQFARLFVGITEEITFDEGATTVEPDQYSLASSSSTQVGGILKVAIPIILAATIIFNTMLGAVMERKKEVSIYNAIGLNPGHVMMFFLAESMVFGLVGSVAGYLIGQVLSLLITHFNLLELNLNYSSMSVMVVIFLTIATVLLSTIYPAMMAARAAVPSGQRRWSLPQPEGDEIHVAFPFSYDATRVLGVCAYLRDYMQQHSEASTGNFLATLGAVGRVPEVEPVEEDAMDNKALCMLFDVAPAPFDLGVNQKMEVYAYYNKRVRAHMLAVHLTRVSGEINNWVAVNQPFLEALRKRLLGWRSQKEEIHETFYRQGEKLFKDAPDLPVKNN